MNKILVTIGISGSGKSTWAHQLWQTQPFMYTIINRDKIRELIFGYTEGGIAEYYNNEKLGKYEKEVTKLQNVLINEALASGKTPIVDATHLNVKYLQEFKFWNVPVEFVWFNVDPKTAAKRTMGRERSVDHRIIFNQYEQIQSLKRKVKDAPELLDMTTVKLRCNPDLPNCVLVDIDGTLAHMNLRLPYDWHRVGEDTVDVATASLVRDLKSAGNTKIIICTGRDAVCLPETEQWLADNKIPYDGIFIRPEKDQRPDWVVKEEMWRKITQVYNIEYLIDDRLQVVRRARALGLKVMNVEYNNF